MLHSTMYTIIMITSSVVSLQENPKKEKPIGTLKGKVIFSGNAADYKREVLKTQKDPACKKSKKKIGTEGVIINKKTDPMTIRNALVYIKDGLGKQKYTPPTQPFVLDQFGCQYKPHVIAIMAGQPLRVRNSDETNHNIHLLPKINQPINFSQPKKGMEKDIILQVEDIFKIKCDVHPWMGCYIKVFDHPFFCSYR